MIIEVAVIVVHMKLEGCQVRVPAQLLLPGLTRDIEELLPVVTVDSDVATKHERDGVGKAGSGVVPQDLGC